MDSEIKNAAEVGFITSAPAVASNLTQGQELAAALIKLGLQPQSFAGNLPKGWGPAASIAEAEFLSLPRPRERCRYSGLSRTTLVELLNRGDIRGVTIRRAGATRGKRLLIKKSLSDYLYGLAHQAATKAAAHKEVI